jgi:SAM-dependent methyltransferase
MEPTEENIRVWDELHRRLSQQPDEPTLPDLVRERLPNLEGRHVLHVNCGDGAETVELAALGALVTGVDPSEQALTVARRRDPAVAWVQAHPESLPLELQRGRFHLVYATGLAIHRRAIEASMRGIEGALRPGGYLLLHAPHPVAAHVDALGHWRADYFEPGAPRLGELLTALGQAGLVLRRLEEFPLPKPQDRVPGGLLLVAKKPG